MRLRQKRSQVGVGCNFSVHEPREPHERPLSGAELTSGRDPAQSLKGFGVVQSVERLVPGVEATTELDPFEC
jgi:hypothetical protein